MYRWRWYCWAILSEGLFSELRPIYQDCGALTFALARLSCFFLQILRTIPFRQIDVSVLSVEYVHGRSGKQKYAAFMKQEGYVVHKDIYFHDPPMTLFVDDFIFVKNTLADRWRHRRQLDQELTSYRATHLVLVLLLLVGANSSKSLKPMSDKTVNGFC